MPIIILFLFLITALAILFVGLYSKIQIRDTYLRVFQIESKLLKQEKQCINLSRIACLAEARARVPNFCSQLSTYSQHGEELYIWQLLDFKLDGFFIEIGAYDGIRLSNSYFFEKIGWKGILIEAHPELAKQCKVNRPNSITLHTALGSTDGGNINFSVVTGKGGVDTLSFVSANDKQLQRIKSAKGIITTVDVPSRNLDSILKEYEIDNIDFISIDVEGVEIDVLKGINFSKYKPNLLVIEDNSGGSDKSVSCYMQQYGYVKITTIGCNDFYLLNTICK